MTAPVVHRVADRAAQAREMAAFVAERLRVAIRERGQAVLAVSGGRSPVPFFEALREAPIAWPQVTLLLVDERVVPAHHPDSNTALVQRHLRQGAAAAVRWLPLLDPAWGAGEWAGEPPRTGVHPSEDTQAPSDPVLTRLADEADARIAAGAAALDVAVLGMGEDGHTASLFPDDPRREAWAGSRRHVDWARPASAPHARLTLTLPRLQAARTLVLGVQGDAKRAVFERAGLAPTPDLPLSLLLVPPAPPVQVWIAP